ncbi:hypothetical protein [Roseibium sediminis]|uniref:hypothetical protein n=1 Tax=Roseibium sediminis TaxID=1775174 RepID=UPI00123DEAE6|nr:hypothetical protein [Roseibium sediminis]
MTTSLATELSILRRDVAADLADWPVLKPFLGRLDLRLHAAQQMAFSMEQELHAHRVGEINRACVKAMQEELYGAVGQPTADVIDLSEHLRRGWPTPPTGGDAA